MLSSRHLVTAVLAVVLVAYAGEVELKRCTVCMDADAVGRQRKGRAFVGGDSLRICVCACVQICVCVCVCVHVCTLRSLSREAVKQ